MTNNERDHNPEAGEPAPMFILRNPILVLTPGKAATIYND